MAKQFADVTSDILNASLNEDFASLLDETFAESSATTGSVVKGVIVNLDSDAATVDVGLKSEGLIPLREFIEAGQTQATVSVGDEVDVFVENIDFRGQARLSHEKAKREQSLNLLEKAHADKETVKGIIFGRVKGGFSVDVQGVLAFLPGSQVDVRPIKDITPYMNTPLDFEIVKIDRSKGNVIISRRSVMEGVRSESKDEILEDMAEGKVLDGVVKNITDYGAFIDLGGVDGLLHITDIAWHRITHPSQALKIGETISVQVIKFNEDTKRISLGLKQLNEDPWAKVDADYPIGKKVKGTVTNITDYGAFVELAPGIEGLIHVSEMSWTKKNAHPGKMLSTSEEVEVMVLEINRDNRRISLGLKQCMANPWADYAANHKEGETVKGQIRNITDFGIFVALNDDLDGLLHMSDISWEKSGEEAIKEFKKGDEVEAKILALDVDRERVSLGIKQLSEDPFANAFDGVKKGAEVKAKVTAVAEDFITVEVAEGLTAEIRKNDLSKDRAEQDTARFKEGDEISAKVMRLDNKERTIALSIKALEVAQEKEAVKALSNNDEGSASLGDVLSKALGK
ncbi:MAG: 30S ribosomal protein S1 [Proteobacteria bacterium]|nr:MAG: 30S ribosomal protein S1 [Pseudomonadota bacterium]|tara:strand:- start:57 stop:1769 length:1713 start_codon:yes stop_codon:yes gene_type:complete